MARLPRLKDAGSTKIVILSTPEEKASFMAHARYYGLTLSDLVRLLLRQDRKRLERAGDKVPKK